MSSGFDDRLEIGDLLARLRRRWVWILLPLLIIGSLSAAYGFTRPAQYRSESRVLLSGSAAEQVLRTNSQNTGFLNRELSNEVSLATSDDVRRRVAENLGFLPRISVSSVDGADVLAFTSIGGNPEEVAAGANTWAEVYIEIKREEALLSISSAIDSLRGRLVELERERRDTSEEDSFERVLLDAEVTALTQSITQLQLRGDLAGTGTARMLQVAGIPRDKTNTNPIVLFVVGVIVGLGVGLGLALFRDSLDRTVSSEEDLINHVGIPVLGQIPRPDRRDPKTELGRALVANPDGAIAGAYRVLQSALEFYIVDQDIRSILITSPNESEGKTTTSSNLSWASASAGKRTIVVDVDYRRPRLHAVLGYDIAPGLSDTIIDGDSTAGTLIDVGHPFGNLSALTSGTAPVKPGEFVATPQFGEAIRRLSESTERVILDAAPVLPVADAATIARQIDATILVVRAGSTTLEDTMNALSKLRVAGANVIGIVLTGVRAGSKYSYYGGTNNGQRGDRSNRSTSFVGDRDLLASSSLVGTSGNDS